MYLHNNKELFKDVLTVVSNKTGFSMGIIEKDYYVTLILKLLSESKYKFVFKGGTSLSKAFRIISRFSEDIDVTFEEHLGENKRKRLKYEILKPIENELNVKIENFDNIESDKDYNHYDYYYDSVCDGILEDIPAYVKLETALMSYAFPTEMRLISNYIYDSLYTEEKELIEKYDLLPFEMCCQTLERTLIDKLFAVCDYYLLNKSKRNSRHLYDIYKLSKHVDVNKINELIPLVRKHRLTLGEKIAPAANEKYAIINLYNEIFNTYFYRDDYNSITKKLILDEITYEEIEERIRKYSYLLKI